MYWVKASLLVNFFLGGFFCLFSANSDIVIMALCTASSVPLEVACLAKHCLRGGLGALILGSCACDDAVGCIVSCASSCSNGSGAVWSMLFDDVSCGNGVVAGVVSCTDVVGDSDMV